MYKLHNTLLVVVPSIGFGLYIVSFLKDHCNTFLYVIQVSDVWYWLYIPLKVQQEFIELRDAVAKVTVELLDQHQKKLDLKA